MFQQVLGTRSIFARGTTTFASTRGTTTFASARGATTFASARGTTTFASTERLIARGACRTGRSPPLEPRSAPEEPRRSRRPEEPRRSRRAIDRAWRLPHGMSPDTSPTVRTPGTPGRVPESPRRLRRSSGDGRVALLTLLGRGGHRLVVPRPAHDSSVEPCKNGRRRSARVCLFELVLTDFRKGCLDSTRSRTRSRNEAEVSNEVSNEVAAPSQRRNRLLAGSTRSQNPNTAASM